MSGWYRWDNTELVLRIKVQPGSKYDEITGSQGDVLKIRVTAPPVDGKANKYLCHYLAKICKVKKAQILIESGQSSRNKVIRIQLEEQNLPACFAKLSTGSQ